MNAAKKFAILFDQMMEQGVDEEGCPAGLTLQDVVIRDLLAWRDGIKYSISVLNKRSTRLENTSQADRLNLDEVDVSVRQTWEALDARIRKLEE